MNKGCEEEIILTFGLFRPKKGEVRAETVHVPKALRNLMGYRRLSCTRLPEENESALRTRIVYPLNNVVQEVGARSWQIVSLDVGAPASLVRDFSDFSIKVCVPVVTSTILRRSGPHTNI